MMVPEGLLTLVRAVLATQVQVAPNTPAPVDLHTMAQEGQDTQALVVLLMMVPEAQHMMALEDLAIQARAVPVIPAPAVREKIVPVYADRGRFTHNE